MSWPLLVLFVLACLVWWFPATKLDPKGERMIIALLLAAVLACVAVAVCHQHPGGGL